MRHEETRSGAGWRIDDAQRFQRLARAIPIHRIATEIRHPQLVTDERDTVRMRLALSTWMHARSRVSNDLSLRPKASVGVESDHCDVSGIVRDGEPLARRVERERTRETAAARTPSARLELQAGKRVTNERTFTLRREVGDFLYRIHETVLSRPDDE